MIFCRSDSSTGRSSDRGDDLVPFSGALHGSAKCKGTMKNASKLAYFALLLSPSGFGCGATDNLIGTKPGSGSAGAGRLAEVAGNGNGSTSGGAAAAGGVTDTDGRLSAGAGSTSAGTASVGDGVTPTPGGIGGIGGTSGVAANGTASGGSDDAQSSAGGNGGESSPLLTPTNGWLDRTSNDFEIQGALFANADSTSSMSMSASFTGARACIAGMAARVDLLSPPCQSLMFTPPATDCYGEFWGASLNLNLNQPAMGDTPLPYDASALQGFAFEISGDTVPAPSALRFQVHAVSGVFCNPVNIKLKVGVNTVFFRDLLPQCWVTQIPDLRPTAESVKSALISIEWRVVTNGSSAVPYDFCVSNLRALPR